MINMELWVQTCMDGALLALCAFSFFGWRRRRLDAALPLLMLGLCLVARVGLGQSRDALTYVILPIDNLPAVLFLFLAVLLLHSLWFHVGEGHIFIGTVAVLGLYLLLRELCLLLLALCGLEQPIWYLYGSRLLSMLLWLILRCTGAPGWLRDKLTDGDPVICMVCANTTVLLLIPPVLWWQDFSALFRALPVTAGALVALVLVDVIVIALRQHRIQALRRTVMLEQYLPLVEELIEQVRARQHDFNNQMMAVSAAVATAGNLQEAQENVSALLQNVRRKAGDQDLLKCDSKVIGGLLFGKLKQAEQGHIRVEVTITGTFLHRALSEGDWAELIAILLDNAIEAAEPGDVLYVKAAEEPGGLRFTVSNPHGALSNVEFVQMFRRGWSTKGDGAHGYGLYNVSRMVDRHGGKLITGNETLDGNAYITIGVLIP